MLHISASSRRQIGLHISIGLAAKLSLSFVRLFTSLRGVSLLPRCKINVGEKNSKRHPKRD